MKCPVCAQDYGVAHNCPGLAVNLSPEEAAPPPAGFAPLYYLSLAFNIARWDDISIRRASRDPRAGVYGAFLWAFAAGVILLVTLARRITGTTNLSGSEQAIGLMAGLIFGLGLLAIITFVQLGLCHLVAKLFFGATGSFVGVMRPLLLGWFVNVLLLVPGVGLLAGAVAWTAVLMLVFEEVDGIGRLQAFFISAGVNFVFTVLQYALPSG